MKRKKKSAPTRQWSPPPSAISVPENEALDALASVLAPRVLRALHDRVVDMVSYERAEGVRVLSELGYEAIPNADDAAAEALIRMLACSAVIAVKEYMRSVSPKPDWCTDEPRKS